MLTSRSAVDRSFWAEVERHRVTGIAGVPHSFELLERLGEPTTDLPALRYVTQAGGRMAPATTLDPNNSIRPRVADWTE